MAEDSPASRLAERAREIARSALRNYPHGTVTRDRLDEFVEAVGAALLSVQREARAEARAEAAALLDQVARADDESAVGEAAADAFNTGNRRPMSERLRDWNAVLAAAIRRLTEEKTDAG